MNSSLMELKSILFSILEESFKQSDVTATQQMGVNLSNSIRKDGVVIIQNQNVEVYARIVPNIVKSIKLCDLINENRVLIPEKTETIDITEVVDNDDTDPIKECCEWLFENKIGWIEMQELMRKRYMNHVISQFKTKADAAKFLKVGSTYLSKLTVEKEAYRETGQLTKA